MSAEIDAAVSTLQGTVAQLTSAVGDIVTLVTKLSGQLTAAIAAAQAAGATPQELQALADLNTTIVTQAQALANAVAAVPPATV